MTEQKARLLAHAATEYFLSGFLLYLMRPQQAISNQKWPFIGGKLDTN